MSRLDLMPQATQRFAEVPRSASSATDGQSGGKGLGGGTEGFDSLLEGLTKEQGREGADLQADVMSSLAMEETGDAPAADLSGLQALLSGTATDGSSIAAAPLQAGHQAYSVIEGLLPRLLSQAGGGRQFTQGPGDGALASMLSMPDQDMAADSILSPAIGPKLSVSVQNQETHFRPVVEGFETALQDTDVDDAVRSLGEAIVEGPRVDKLKEAGPKLPSTHPQGAPSVTSVDSNIEPIKVQKREEERSFDRTSLDRIADRGEVQKPSAPGPQKSDGGSLPSGTLHQMARAILDDVAGISGPQQASFPSDGVNRVAIARASGGVLRVLNLQLNPVELGLVTIKMRLTGDSLEMELQVEREETAELLKHDAEKLSGLLRTSGYRPDLITIQSTESTAQERNPFQRQQQGEQDQSFQGSATGQDHSSGQRHGPYEKEGAERRNDPKENRTSDNRSSGGVYL